MGKIRNRHKLLLYTVVSTVSLCIAGVWGCVAVSMSPSTPADGYAGMEGEYISVRDLNIHTFTGGVEHDDRIPVVFIHGFAATFYCWRFNAEPLAVDRPVFAPDLPGFGLSDKPRDYDYSLDSYADFIAAYMDEMGVERAVLVGNSMGGGIAMRTEVRHPDRVAGLVLIDALGYFKNEFYFYKALSIYPLAEIIMSLNNRPVMTMILKTRVYVDDAYVTDEVVDSFMVVNETENGRRAPVWVLRAMDPHPTIPADEIKRVSAPTLVIWGEEDRILPVRHAELFSRDIEHAETIIIPDVGHVPMEERGDEVNEFIEAFIDDLS